MKFNAFSLLEQIIVLIIVSILFVVMLTIMRPNNIKEETLKKSGKSTFIQIEFATKRMLARDTNNYTLERMVDSTGEFSIADSTSSARTTELFKKHLIAIRNSTLDSTYAATTLTNGTTSLDGYSPSSFSGFMIKNGTYFGLKLHGNCTTTVNFLYDPSTPNKNSRTNTCGIIFYDINGKNPPNMLGVDQYIISIGKMGVK